MPTTRVEARSGGWDGRRVAPPRAAQGAPSGPVAPRAAEGARGGATALRARTVRSRSERCASAVDRAAATPVRASHAPGLAAQLLGLGRAALRLHDSGQVPHATGADLFGTRDRGEQADRAAVAPLGLR